MAVARKNHMHREMEGFSIIWRFLWSAEADALPPNPQKISEIYSQRLCVGAAPTRGRTRTRVYRLQLTFGAHTETGDNDASSAEAGLQKARNATTKQHIGRQDLYYSDIIMD